GISLVPAVVVDAETLAQMGAVGKQFFPEEVIFSSCPPMVTDFQDGEIVVRYVRTRHGKREQASEKRVQKAEAVTPESLTKHRSAFTQGERDAVYRAIRERRDVRSGYLPRPLENDILFRLLSAAHMAPSVGLMQPWRFIVVRDAGLRAAVHDNFLRSNRKAAAAFASDRRAAYGRLRLEGLLDAPQHLCVLCDAFSKRGHGLGRDSMPQTAAY